MKGTLFKKLTACALAVAMVATAMPQVSGLTGLLCGSEITASAETYSGQCGEDAFWSYDSDTRKLTITGEGEMTTAPWRDSYGAYITSVEIEKGITSICSSAFRGCSHLTRVVIPCSVNTIDKGAFRDCESLNHVTIPEGVETIGKEAFRGCSWLASVTIPSSVVTIGDNAFDESTVVELAPVEQLTFPEKTTEIGANSILGPARYSSVVVPSTVKTIAGNAFRDCTNLTSIYMLCDPSQLTWDVTNGDYILYNSNNLVDKVNIYYPSKYVLWYFQHANSYPMKDAQFIPGYNVSVDGNIANGSVSADRFMAGERDTVTLTVTPDEGYAVKSVSVNGSTSGVTKKADGTYSFIMPAGDVDVSAQFAFIGAHLYGHSLSLDGDIGVNFYMELDDSVKHSETAKMIFTVPNGSKNETQELNVKEVTEAASNAREIDGKTYYQFKCKVSAKDMASPIKAQIVDGDTKGTEYTYSVREYAKYILDNPDDFFSDEEEQEKLLNLVKAMLNYGSAAQEYFLNEWGSDLANYDLATNYYAVDWVSAGDIDKPYDPALTYLPEGVTFEGVTLSLKSETTLSLYFKSDKDLTLHSCRNEYTSADYNVDVEHTGDYWVFRIRGISAAELDDRIALDFGVPAIDNGGYVDYCPLTYCYNVLDRNEGTPQLQKVCKALFLYNQAANDYFDKTEA